jgi:hypothetical protein
MMVIHTVTRWHHIIDDIIIVIMIIMMVVQQVDVTGRAVPP